MSLITARHLDGDRFGITIRGHEITVDQPVADGGTDSAPTPTELFVAALASCVAHYARRYLARHELPTAGLAVTAEYAMGSRPSRVSDVSMVLDVPDDVPQERLEALLAVASHCTVHNSLRSAPTVTLALRGPRSSPPKSGT
jgi:uncharacterized OsmC-like protein